MASPMPRLFPHQRFPATARPAWTLSAFPRIRYPTIGLAAQVSVCDIAQELICTRRCRTLSVSANKRSEKQLFLGIVLIRWAQEGPLARQQTEDGVMVSEGR